MRNYGREVLTERYQVQNLNRKKIILFIDSAKQINIFVDIRHVWEEMVDEVLGKGG